MHCSEFTSKRCCWHGCGVLGPCDGVVHSLARTHRAQAPRTREWGLEPISASQGLMSRARLPGDRGTVSWLRGATLPDWGCPWLPTPLFHLWTVCPCLPSSDPACPSRLSLGGACDPGSPCNTVLRVSSWLCAPGDWVLPLLSIFLCWFSSKSVGQCRIHVTVWSSEAQRKGVPPKTCQWEAELGLEPQILEHGNSITSVGGGVRASGLGRDPLLWIPCCFKPCWVR